MVPIGNTRDRLVDATPMRDINQQNSVTPLLELQDSITYAGSTNETLVQLKVKQLESELQLKESAIDLYLKEYINLREQLMTCIQYMQKTARQLVSVNNNLTNDHQQLLAQIDQLQKANKALQGTNEAWANRAITLQFEGLTAQGEIIAIKADHELAISKITKLETELKAVKSENDTLKIQKTPQIANNFIQPSIFFKNI